MVTVKPQPPERPERDPVRELKLTCMSNLLSSAEERVYFKDKLSRFILVSVGWIAAYTPGRTAEDLAGKTDFDVFSYQHAATALKDEQQIMCTGKPIVGKVERETYKGRQDAWVSTTNVREAGGSHGATMSSNQVVELASGLLAGRVRRGLVWTLVWMLPVFAVSIVVCTKAWIDGLLGRQYTDLLFHCNRREKGRA